MFEFIRQHQRLMQGLLVLLILPSFTFFGVQSYSSFMNREPELATVDGQAILLSEFNRAHKAQLEKYQSALGGQFDATAFDTPELRQQVLDNLIDQRTIALAAEKARFSVSDETLRRTIASIPAVQQDGQFSPEKYRQILAAQGMTPPIFENTLRRDLALAQVLSPVSGSAMIPDVVVQRFLSLLGEKRTVSVKPFKADAYKKSVNVTPEQTSAWYDAHQATLKIPENVDIEYILINESAASKDITVSEAEVETFYKQNQARYGLAERRLVSHILIEVANDASAETKTKAQGIATDLVKMAQANPKDFGALAKKFSQDSGTKDIEGDLGWISKGMLVPEVESAIFAAEKGQVSGPVQSQFGYHIILVRDVDAATVKPLADVKSEILVEIRKQIAADRFATMSDKMTKLIYDQRDSLKPVADALGLPILKAQGLSRSGLLSGDQGGSKVSVSAEALQILNNPKVAQAAFSSDVLKTKLNSGVITLSPDTMLTMRVSQINEAHVPPLKEIETTIREKVLVEQANDLAKAAALAYVDSLKADHASAKLNGFEAPFTVSRQSKGSLTKDQLDQVMMLDAKSLPAYAVLAGGEGYEVLQLTKVDAAPPAQAGEIAQLKQELAQAYGGAEERASLAMLRQAFKVELLPSAAKLISGELNEAK